MNTDRYYEMKRCKTDWFDDIFLGTKESQGLRNATNAVKLVLFDDYSVVPDGLNLGNKWEFISSRRDGRAKAKMLQDIDLIQILSHYALCSFGIKNKNFEIDYDTYLDYRTNRKVAADFSHDYVVELVAYALMDSIFGGYIFINSNKIIKDILIDAFLNERYIENKKEELDAFDGHLINTDIFDDAKYLYYDAFTKLDDDFFKIKRRDKEYVAYETLN